MKVANIVSNTKESVSDDFNVVTSLYDAIQGLPTLIIGWEYIKKTYPNYNIFERKIESNLYWTFKKTENRELHDQDIYNFSVSTYKTLIKNIKYYFIDPVTLKKSGIKKFLTIINNAENIICYHNLEPTKSLDMVYMLINDYIYGIDLNLLEYMGFNKVKIFGKIRKSTHVFLEKKDIFIEYEKGLELLDNQIKYIPFLYSIKNG